MIPEELHLRNFLSHRETDLDLRGVHLASLVGDNGAGKSALLDAITWAVWGRSRAPYGHDDDLVYHGEDMLEVEFTFRMPYQGGDEHRCRILRRREQRSRRAVGSTLDFQVEGEEGWRSLTADSIRDTQTRIIEELGLDYDTFINSAYLRQGHADEFTVQSATERKRVLSSILGLDRWSEYQERAKKRLSVAQGQLKEMDRRLMETTNEIERRPEHQATLEAAENRVQEAEAHLRFTQGQMDEINRVQEQALALGRRLEDLDRRIAEEENRLTQLQGEATAHADQQTHYQEVVEQAEAIEARYQGYQEALAEERAWGDKLSQAARLQAEKSHHEKAIAAAREDLNAQLRAAEQKATRLERAIAAAQATLERALSDCNGQIAALSERLVAPELLQELAEAEQTLSHLTEIAATSAQARETLQAGEVEKSQLTERNRQLRILMDETKSRLDALAAAEADCPLCRQPLTPEHHQRLLATIEAEGTQMGDEFRANKARIQELQQERAEVQQAIQDYERELAARPRLEQRVARLQQQIEQGETADQQMGELRVKVADLEAQLAAQAYAPDEHAALAVCHKQQSALAARLSDEDYAPEAREELQATLNELATLGYDDAAHRQIKARIATLSIAEGEYRELEKARISVEKEAETLKRLALEVEAQTQRAQQVRDERVTQVLALDALQPQLAQAPRMAELLDLARREESAARQSVGAARQTLAALQTLERRLVAMRGDHDALARRVALLSELRDAFSVNGIPAMIIEHTLPELEHEANYILQRLSGGRMHVRFETQRETKTGDLRETLDIIISDEKGTRPYENYSGGEQFRINFAIRVALSRMLAQRAGVRLRSLFVDEGFGALDEDGRQRLVEAVKAVQNEFDLILVITHVAELREAFPTQIQVLKADVGSVVEVT
ncbi:MAG: SMC family ATPase [Anaerolineae bacterium]|nr:SMC family ATPase [Anaerolineae bacterium]